MDPGDSPFAELPAALVEEVLRQSSEVGDVLLHSLRNVRAERAALRYQLQTAGLVIHESTLGYPPFPTTCGTDGSYAIERLLTVDLVAAAAVSMEGLTPPSETRYWQQPRHSTYIAAETHHSDTATVLRAVMLGRGLILAAEAPHDMVMIDGTFTLPVIYFNQAMNAAPMLHSLRTSREFMEGLTEYLKSFALLVHPKRSDRQFIALPKYSSRREIGTRLGWKVNHDDRALLTLLLSPGELTRPVPMEQPGQAWHFNTDRLPDNIRIDADALAESILQHVSEVHVFYYRPHEWLPALRVEVPKTIANNVHRLSIVVQGLKHQCATPSMLEPYPVYIADRTVKALARAVPAFRQVATQRVSEQYDGDIGEVFFAMHGDRTETGV